MPHPEKLETKQNLSLAWKRIRTAQNFSYKRFYRRVYDGLEIGIFYELETLRSKLNHRSYAPQHAQRVFIAKPSGLQRPITFLDPRDQIVFQAIANIAAYRIEPTRKLAIARCVCSNRLKKRHDSIHFFEPWQKSYGLFRKRVEKKLNTGFNYAADFDLASFYDTVSHAKLADSIFPRNRRLGELLKDCLKEWTPKRIRHGLPQGPIASDYLAECYLSLIDKVLLSKKINYLRYVDDVVIFGKSAIQVQSGILALEAVCRDYGLIPQAGKFKPGRKVKYASELVKSASGYSYSVPSGPELSESETVLAYTQAVSKRTRIITQPTLAKRALFRGIPSSRIISRLLKDIEFNPALIEAYAAYLQKFGHSKTISRFMQKMIKRGSPYQFVEGEYWNILTAASKVIDPGMILLAHRLISVSDFNLYPVSLRMALYTVLIKDTTRVSTKLLVRVLRKERTDWLKAWVISHFQRLLKFSEAKRFVRTALRRESLSAYSAAKLYSESRILQPIFPLPGSGLSPSATASLRQLGVINRSPGKPPEAISSLLRAGFSVSNWRGWKKLLGTKYDQARFCLQLASSEYEGNPSSWMGNLDSFNDIVIRSAMDLVRVKLDPRNLPPAVNNRKRKLTDYGYFLTPQNWLASTHPEVCQPFKHFHDRRNHLTSSHAFDSLTNTPNKPLKHSERKGFIRSIRVGYLNLQRLVTPLL